MEKPGLTKDRDQGWTWEDLVFPLTILIIEHIMVCCP